MKQKELSVWIRIIAVLGAVCVVFLGAVVVPEVGSDMALQNPNLAGLYAPCLVFVLATALPVLAVAVVAWRIGAEIGRDNSFCRKNADRLRFCCVMAVLDTALYFLGGVALALMNVLHPGVALLIFGLMAVGVACAVVFAALSHLTRKAAELKSENDLTI